MSYKLNSGYTIPKIALGTYLAANDTEARDSVYHAIKVGYRSIDTATLYGNEEQVGEGVNAAIKDGLAKRSELFITTKVWNTDQRESRKSLEDSLKRLKLDYVDLLLVHWPIAFKKVTDDKGELITSPTPAQVKKYDIYDYDWNFVKTWKVFESLVKTGHVKSIGVSNFSAGKLAILDKYTSVTPAVNQIQISPILPEWDLVEYSQKHGIVVEAWSPFGSNGAKVLKNTELISLAEKKGINVGTLVISWLASRHIVALPKSVTPSRIESNLKIVELDDSDIKLIGEIGSRIGKGHEDSWVPEGLFDDTDLDKWDFSHE